MSSSASVPVSAQTVILGATLIDGIGHDPVSNAAILIEGERIRAVGTRATVAIPQGTQVIEANGMSLLPGLIDTHVHIGMPSGFRLADRAMTPPSLSLLHAVPNSRATLEAGITTVRDAGGTPAGVKMAIERGFFPGPRMQVAITILSQTGGHLDGYLPCGIDLPVFPYPDVPPSVVDSVGGITQRAREIL